MLSQNYFELLGLEPDLSLDEEDVKARGKALQRKFHPDRYINALPAEKTYAFQLSAQVSAAVDALRNPITRIQHLLALQGHAYMPEEHGQLGNDFLMKQMQRKMLLQDKTPSSTKALTESLEAVQSEFNSCFDLLINFRAALLGQIPIETQLQSIYTRLSELMFLGKLKREIQNHLDQIALVSSHSDG